MKPHNPIIALGLLLSASIALAEAPGAAHFAGVWQTTYGKMVLDQEGILVKGSYSYAGTSTIQGTVEGRRLTFRYAEVNVRGEGWFELSPDGQAFVGQWREDGGQAWEAWKGTRVQKAEQRESGGTALLDGLFETPHGRIRFIPSGKKIRGAYVFDGSPGTLLGSVKGSRLTFNWREGGNKGDGWFEPQAGGAAIRGAWRTGPGDSWRPWNGQRVQSRPGVKWLMVLEAYWEESLEEQEYSFGNLLRAYFKRFPWIQVRHRRFGDLPDFLRATRQASLLAEPVLLVVASHGTNGRLIAGQDRIDGETIGRALRDAPNLELLHFSACEMMQGNAFAAIHEAASSNRFAVSGYATAVDWSASALLELLYFDLILTRGQAPEQAAKLLRKELRFAGDSGLPGSPLGGSRFRFRQ